MFSKKAGIAIEEIFGMITFMVVAVIMLMLFFSCNVSKKTQEYTSFELKKDELEANKALNFFLEMPHPTDTKKTVIDLIVESHLSEEGTIAERYSDLNKLAVKYFNARYTINEDLPDYYSPTHEPYWSLTIYIAEHLFDYYSIQYNGYPYLVCDGKLVEKHISFIDKDLEKKELRVTLFVTGKCN